MASRKCWRVGITGGIGTGKSVVCRIFESIGIPVYDADYWAKWLTVHDGTVRAKIKALLGAEAYLPDGTYNRPYVASVVFADQSKLRGLNAIVHPAVERHAIAWHERQFAVNCPYTIKEAALMVESGSFEHLDFLIVVSAPEDLRIRRVMERDQCTEAQVRARMAGQLPEAEKLKLADFVIENDEEKALVPQVWAIHQALLKAENHGPKKEYVPAPEL